MGGINPPVIFFNLSSLWRIQRISFRSKAKKM